MGNRRTRKTARSKSKEDDNDVLSPKNQPLFRAACAIVARKYCDMFVFWRDCRYKPCRSARRCVGDQGACLKKRWPSMSYDARLAAPERMLAQSPPRAGHFLRLAHRYAPDCLLLPRPAGHAKAKAKSRAASRGNSVDEASL